MNGSFNRCVCSATSTSWLNIHSQIRMYAIASDPTDEVSALINDSILEHFALFSFECSSSRPRFMSDQTCSQSKMVRAWKLITSTTRIAHASSKPAPESMKYERSRDVHRIGSHRIHLIKSHRAPAPFRATFGNLNFLLFRSFRLPRSQLLFFVLLHKFAATKSENESLWICNFFRKVKIHIQEREWQHNEEQIKVETFSYHETFWHQELSHGNLWSQLS